MEFRTLYYFLMVAREENITRAAEKLHVTQPTLSRQIMMLEEEVNAQLLIRGKRKVTLTDAGMLLKSRAEEILNIVEKTEKDLASNLQQIEGEVSFGMAECKASHTIFTDILQDYMQDYPKVTFDFYTGNADLIKERIEKGIIDIGILLEPVDIQKFDFIRLSSKERWGIVVNKEHPLARKDTVSAKDLLNIPLIVTKRESIQNEITSWFKNNNEDLHIVATYNLISNAISLVEHQIGSVITIEGSLYNHDQQNIKFIPFDPPLETGVVFAWKKQRMFSPAFSKFIDKIYHRINV